MAFTWAAGNLVEISKPLSWGPSELLLPKECNVNHSSYADAYTIAPASNDVLRGFQRFPWLI